MKSRRYANSRQKACLQCSAAKGKCDRKPGRCSRCVSKKLACAYRAGASPQRSTLAANNSISSASSNPERPFADPSIPYYAAPDSEASLYPVDHALLCDPIVCRNAGSMPPASDQGSNSGPNLAARGVLSHAVITNPSRSTVSIPQELCCPIDPEAIKNRWLCAYIPVPGQKTKTYSASITAFIQRILKAYTAITTRGRGVPPFVHSSQIISTSVSQPLASCLTLLRMCEKPLPNSEDVAVAVLQREMSVIHDQHDTFNDCQSLAAFQAYLLYSMVLFFCLHRDQDPSLREAMMNLQDLACATSRCGLMCIAEQEHVRPCWEAWILMEAKRRTLYTMYLFDSVLSAQDGIPTALGTELTGLPAPSSKRLWHAQTREEWEIAYNSQLADLAHSLRIDELWPIPDGLNAAEVAVRRSRVDSWLQQVDEYGTMLYAVTSCTHGG